MRGGRIHRRGSALLVVLGMLAFMVISAVAFSAYMRSSRLPSSFLRRTSASRLLVKAALAEAIEEIDVAIGDNPHPGITVSTNSAVSDYKYYFPRNETGSLAQNRNWWKGRVYIGTNSQDGIDAELEIAIPQRETVPTLTLEGLAYIPPPLINEARYYSRHSSAGKWHYFPYDSGRYAFTAIDVSDYFDVNAIRADGRRTSAPEDRITLSYLFSDKAPAMGTFMQKLCENKLPLVSLADWNLAINYDQSYGLKSPFCEYIKNPNIDFYGSHGDREEIEKMTFVTDSWFPQDERIGKGDNKILDLADEQNQPFKGGSADSFNSHSYDLNFSKVVDASGDVADRLRKFLPQVSIAALYDYLDRDSVPLSLAIPTTEKSLMICGIQPVISGMKVAFKDPVDSGVSNDRDYEPADPSKATRRRVDQTVELRLESNNTLGMFEANLIGIYPFRGKQHLNYKLQGRAAFFFTTAQMSLRPFDVGSAVDELHHFMEPDAGKVNPLKNGVMTFPFNDKTFERQDQTIAAEDDAIFDAADGLKLGLSNDALANAMGKIDADEGLLLEAKYSWVQTRETNPETGLPIGEWKPTLAEANKDAASRLACEMQITARSGFRALSANGNLDSKLTARNEALVDNLMAGVPLKLNLAMWVRVIHNINDVHNFNKTVDMVPASVFDDEYNDGGNMANDTQSELKIRSRVCGMEVPLMRFDTSVDFVLKIGANSLLDASSVQASGYDVKLLQNQTAVMIRDPRFNYAPENWYRCSDGDFTKEFWKTKADYANRDGDLFLQVSDQGFLQSVYELANLPRLYRNGFRGKSETGDMQNATVTQMASFREWGQEAQGDFMWKSYDPFGRYNDQGGRQANGEAEMEVSDYRGESGKYVGDGFEALGIVNSGIGFKINPYTDSTNIMMAAFANTPYDWRSASVDNEELPEDSKEFNQNHTWNESSPTCHKLSDLTLEDLAGAVMETVRDSSIQPIREEEEPWEAAFSRLGWCSSGMSPMNEFLIDGVKNTLNGSGNDYKIYNNERKFLYGYWRECFAAKQQLFLIFVRAEPTMMGSGSFGKAPPQLGGRAVALVWRDPKAAAGNDDFTSASEQGVCVPHKTRILFYRTLE